MWPFWGLFYPLPPLDQCWILCWWSNLCFCQHLSFQHWLGGEGVSDHFFTFMWSDPSMMPSFFVAFLSVKTIKNVFDMTSYFPQNRTLWTGQSLSSPFNGKIQNVFQSFIKKLKKNILFNILFFKIHVIMSLLMIFNKSEYSVLFW